MINSSISRRGPFCCLMRSGLAAAAILLVSAVSGQHAQAMSLVNPGPAPMAKTASGALTTEVRGGGGHSAGGSIGGGAASHSAGAILGGGLGAGGAAFHSSAIPTGGATTHSNTSPTSPVSHGTAVRTAHRHHFHRPFFYGAPYYPYYDDYAYYPPHRHCRVVWTKYGIRRICHFHHPRHYG